MIKEISPPPFCASEKYPLPNRELVKDKYRADFDRRVLALKAVEEGGSILSAAKAFGVDRTTLSAMVATAPTVAPDGKPYGFRVCIPWYRAAEPKVTRPLVPAAPGPNAFAQLLGALPEIKRLVSEFKGKLPSHNEPSPKFDAFFRRFKAELRNLELQSRYPLNRKDRGRRALLNWLKRERAFALDIEMGNNDDAPSSISRLDSLFRLKPLDRIEGDAHKIDNDWYGLVPTKEGQWTAELVSSILILAAIDVVSLVAYPAELVIGPSYDRFDVLQMTANTVTPWKPRDLIIPDLTYLPGAWMPTMVADSSDIYRPLSIAIDNAMAHKAKLTTANLGDHQLGICNLGFPHVPEGRPHIEAFFKRIEEAVLRYLAGAYRPASDRAKVKQATTNKSGRDYPVDFEALKDLIDVEISTYNITPHPSLQNRTPRQVFESHINSGMWLTQSHLTATDANELLIIDEIVTIRGDRSKKVLPYVKYQYAKYRSRKLNGRYDLVGKTFRAQVHFYSAHQMMLWDSDGNLFAVLEALRPWHVPHNIQTRGSIVKCAEDGHIDLKGTEDAVAAYHAFVRAKASTLQWATDAYVRNRLQASQGNSPPARPTPFGHLTSLRGLEPRGGQVDLRTRRKR